MSGLAAECLSAFHRQMPRSHLAVLRHVASLDQPWNVTGDMEDWPVIDEFERTGLIEGRRLRAFGVGKQIHVLRLTGEGFERMGELEKTETSMGIIVGNRWKIYAAILGALGTIATAYIIHSLTK